MSLEVRNISKRYGKQWAVDDVSFSVGKGEIVGFLGPNGAGKSTTMKIITGAIRPTSGSVFLEGFDVAEKPLEAKLITGYLPEQNPLYLDMYVKEYLQFVGRLYQLRGERLTQRIVETMERCGLSQEQHKKLGALSKGYRQRVGLAQALIHDPKVLILDEPTSGLDPNQIVEIRTMIASISREKTVLFSTHLMQEAHALCKKIVIIHRGKVVAADAIEALLQAGEGEEKLFVRFRNAVDQQTLAKVAGVKRVIAISPSHFRLLAHKGVDLRESIFSYASQEGNSLVELRQETPTMEQVFQELTEGTSSTQPS